MKFGWCFTNGQPNNWTYNLFAMSNAQACKLMVHHVQNTDGALRRDVADTLRLINPYVYLYARLYDSQWGWRDAAHQPTPRELAEANAQLARSCLALGIKAGQWDNEPQMLARWGADGYKAWVDYTSEALAIYREIGPPEFDVGMAPFAAGPGHNLNLWLDAAAELGEAFAHICANIYWQDLPQAMAGEPVQLFSAANGALYIGYHERWPDKEIVIAELNTALADYQPRPARAVIYRAMAEQLPLKIRELRGQPAPQSDPRAAAAAKAVRAAFVFILPGSGPEAEQWINFWGNELTARAMARTLVCG